MLQSYIGYVFIVSIGPYQSKLSLNFCQSSSRTRSEKTARLTTLLEAEPRPAKHFFKLLGKIDISERVLSRAGVIGPS